ncbi:uncharacterized protein L201_007604 [Kwoniella dendrophila CBS 6074]|uniref:Uncharacterized protein n=1 Tax=Kwoniella dendrophila CBS 6074 TaxID=1295534 RepID=A0AAX4K761_9TREE
MVVELIIGGAVGYYFYKKSKAKKKAKKQALAAIPFTPEADASTTNNQTEGAGRSIVNEKAEYQPRVHRTEVPPYEDNDPFQPDHGRTHEISYHNHNARIERQPTGEGGERSQSNQERELTRSI